MATPNCPYCGERAKLMPSTEFYASGIDYGLLYVCLPCDARIGVRTQTAHLPEPEPSGLMANAQLRFAKKKAHSAFDLLWRRELMSRASAYKWLAAQMQIPPKECHIAMFDITRCQLAETLSHAKFIEFQSEKTK
jgi:zinc-finger-containing domain